MIIAVIEKGIKVIEFLSGHSEGISLAGISSALGIPKSSVHHILQTYMTNDYVKQDPETKKYSLGAKFLQLSSKILEGFDIRKIARSYLLELQQVCKETVQIYILSRGKMVCIEKIGHPSGGLLSISSFVGWTTEPHPSAAGKVLLSELPEEEILKIYPNRRLKPYGKNTITDFDEFLDELKIIKKQGYAIDDEEYYEGVRCVSAPVRAGGEIVASISVTGSIFSMTMKKINQNFIPNIIKTAEAISAELVNFKV